MLLKTFPKLPSTRSPCRTCSDPGSGMLDWRGRPAMLSSAPRGQHIGGRAQWTRSNGPKCCPSTRESRVPYPVRRMRRYSEPSLPVLGSPHAKRYSKSSLELNSFKL